MEWIRGFLNVLYILADPILLEYRWLMIKRCLASSPFAQAILYATVLVFILAPSWYHSARYALLVLIPLAYNVAPMVWRHWERIQLQILEDLTQIIRRMLLDVWEEDLRWLNADLARWEAWGVAKPRAEADRA